MFTLRNYSQLCKATDILCGPSCMRAEGGIKIKSWHRPITYFHNISGAVTQSWCHASRVTPCHVTPEVSLSCCHICHIVPGDQEQRRQDKDGSLHCEARFESRSQGDTELYLHCLLFLCFLMVNLFNPLSW